jgi:hypothetical protein
MKGIRPVVFSAQYKPIPTGNSLADSADILGRNSAEGNFARDNHIGISAT